MLYLFNTNIVPGEAVVRVTKITAEQARQHAANSAEITSAIGHESTAAAMSELLGFDVPVNRIQAQPKGGDVAISLKINGRLPEGQILDRDVLDAIGWELFLIEFYDVREYDIVDWRTVASK